MDGDLQPPSDIFGTPILDRGVVSFLALCAVGRCGVRPVAVNRFGGLRAPPDPPKKKIWERGKQSMLGTRGNALLPLAPPSVRVIQEGADMLFPIPKF